jgi:hypothetical protein
MSGPRDLHIEHTAQEREERGERNSGFVRQFRILNVGARGVAWPDEVRADAYVPLIKSIEERKMLTCLARCSITNLQTRVDFHDYFYTFI